MTFPFGVFSLAVIHLAEQTQLHAIQQFGTFFAVLLCTLWLLVMLKTIQGFYRGSLFFSPCLKAYCDAQSAS
jgi:hypothetical protein